MADTNKVLTPDMLTKEGLETLWGVIAKTFEPSVEGKGLSKNDFSDEDKEKLESMTDAIKNDVDGAWVIKGTLAPTKVEATETNPESYVVDEVAITAVYTDTTPMVGEVFSVVVPGNKTFTTSAIFIETEQSKNYPSGTNIVYTENGWDVVTGHYDFTPLLKKDEVKDISIDEIDEICKLEITTEEEI